MSAGKTTLDDPIEDKELISNSAMAIEFLKSICTSYTSVFDYKNPAQVYPKITDSCTIVDHRLLTHTTTEDGWLLPQLTSYCITDPLQNGGMTNVVVVVVHKNADNVFCIKEAYGRADSVKQPKIFKTLNEEGAQLINDSSRCIYRSQKPDGYCLYNASFNARERLKVYAAENPEKIHDLYVVCLYYENQNHYNAFDLNPATFLPDADSEAMPLYYNITNAAIVSDSENPLLVASHLDKQTALTISYYTHKEHIADDVSGLIATPSCETMFVPFDLRLSDPSLVQAYTYFDTYETIETSLPYDEKKKKY